MPSAATKPASDRFQGLIDYSARTAFLTATTDLLRPAPIDDLLESVPTVETWLATIPQTAPLTVERFSITMGLASCLISPLDDSSEAAEVKHAIAAWMKNCRFFRDEWKWILDYAEPTLLLHAFARCERRKWYFKEPWRELHPELPSFSQRGNESYSEFIKRSDQEYRQRRKENLRSVRFRTGALTLTESRDARWAIHRLCLERTFAEICNDELIESGIDEDTVRKAVRAFRRRTGL
jgi:hypothetical protein